MSRIVFNAETTRQRERKLIFSQSSFVHVIGCGEWEHKEANFMR